MNRHILWVRAASVADDGLRDSLAELDYTLEIIADEEALSGACLDQPPAALITDIERLDVTSRLRDKLQNTQKAECPLLVISSQTDLKSRLLALRQGAGAYFPPPFEAPAIAAKLAELVDEKGKSAPHKVMVVDDDPSQASFAAVILGKAGMQVSTVTESLKILETLRSFMPELILMDVYMPDASGVELTTVIREQKDLMHIPIVYLSAEHDPDKQMDALSVGGEDFLTKPISPKQLVATVRNRVDRARQLREQAAQPPRHERDPALVRKHILELLEKIHSSPSAHDAATGLYYIELNAPIVLLEQINLDGIDRVMSQIKDAAGRVVSEGDRVNRFGDFCLVVLAQRQEEKDLEAMAHQLKKTIDGSDFKLTEGHINTAVSIGLRLLDDADADASLLINEAIRACHAARAAGHDGVQVHRAQPATEATGQAALPAIDEDLVERVMDPSNLQLVYQPVVPLQGSNEALYQSLLRLRSGSGSLLSAGEFLPSVEQTGKILKLDRWVILKALVLLRALRNREQRSLRLFVSQASSILKDRNRIQWLADSMKKTGISGEGLVLEFRFPEIAADLELAKGYLEALREQGIGVSLNSISELDTLLIKLEQLPADFIKITENQIRNYPDTWGKLVDAAHELGRKVIVSRIEHPELLGQLWTHQVDYIQGNFIQHPGEELNYDFTGAVLG